MPIQGLQGHHDLMPAGEQTHMRNSLGRLTCPNVLYPFTRYNTQHCNLLQRSDFNVNLNTVSSIYPPVYNSDSKSPKPRKCFDLPNIFSMNVRSIGRQAAYDGLCMELLSHKVGICCLCETWLTPENTYFSVKGYNCYRRDRSNRRGGGVAVLVSNAFDADIYVVSDQYEIIWCKLVLKRQCVFVASVYLPPSEGKLEMQAFQDEIVEIVSQIYLLNSRSALWLQVAACPELRNLPSASIFHVSTVPTKNLPRTLT